MKPDTRILCPLRSGEIDLIRRALRTYACAEQRAIQVALCAAQEFPRSSKHAEHARDVQRQSTPRIEAAEKLCERLLHDPRGTGKSDFRKEKL